MTRAKPTVCFVALKSYGILADDPAVGQIGGAEVQQVLIARELARRGYRVTFVVHDYGQPDGVDCGGIQVFKKCPVDAGWPGMRFIHPQTTSLWQAMQRANADIYYQRGAGTETGQVAAWCRWRRRHFVFGIASDGNCDSGLSTLTTARERMIYSYGVRRACVVCQTDRQLQALAAGLGIPATVIRTCTMEPARAQLVEGLPNGVRPRVLWVGRFAAVKRPELLIDVAASCPEYDFDIVGAANAPTPYAEGIVNRAEALANVTLHGLVPHARIGTVFSRAVAVMCTSHWEGYPNTFLESWARGIPVVSTVNPDGVVVEHELGRVGTDVKELRQGLHDLLDSAETWLSYSQRCREFYLQHHTVARSVDAYERLFEQMTSTSGHGVEMPVG